MGLDFLTSNGAHRLRNYLAQPVLISDGITLSEDPEASQPDLTYEKELEEWEPLDVRNATSPSHWTDRPVRFVDGKDVGRTVAWLQSKEGYPVPIRLSEIGAVVMRHIDGELRCEARFHERLVTFMGDLFAWDEVEAFAAALQAYNFRVLLCEKGREGYTFDFEPMRQATENCSKNEMLLLERQALSLDPATPTLVDGRLEPKVGAFNVTDSPVVGMIKNHSRNYLNNQGWRTYYALQPGQRTPAFVLNYGMNVVSWYLRLEGSGGEMPNWGVVRLEVPQAYFEKHLGQDWSHLDRLSRLVCEYRCRDDSYSRAPVSIHPIQRAEERLGALFSRSDTIINHFYHLTGL